MRPGPIEIRACYEIQYLGLSQDRRFTDWKPRKKKSFFLLACQFVDPLSYGRAIDLIISREIDRNSNRRAQLSAS